MIIALVAAAGIAWSIIVRFQASQQPDVTGREPKAVPVEVKSVIHGPIEMRRTFSGTLESRSEFVVSPKITGRVERLYVDIGDVVTPGQVIAELDNDEYLQAVAQAAAELSVAEANCMAAENALEIAALELKRFETLRARGVASESQFDAARADHLSKKSQHEVAKAQVTRAEAMLETARIRRGYTVITAQWPDKYTTRFVAERYVNEGDMVTANSRLLSLVGLDPITGVIFVTEKDYGRLKLGQMAFLMTDAYPGTRFTGQINRIAPVFSQATRQAKVELTVENSGYFLKPGMFIRVTVVLDRVEAAVIVPKVALTTRDDKTGVFLVDETTQTVLWQEVVIGIQEDGQVQLLGAELAGRVVTLGQQLLENGTRVTVSDAYPEQRQRADGIEETSVQ
jgi:RND family efflux transporter MFP subunit